MGLNRTPTAILARRGSFINHKYRKDARAGEPVVTKKLGSAPRHMNAEQRKIWSEFARMVPLGVATFADRWAVEIIVCAMTSSGREHHGYRDGPAQQPSLAVRPDPSG